MAGEGRGEGAYVAAYETSGTGESGLGEPCRRFLSGQMTVGYGRVKGLGMGRVLRPIVKSSNIMGMARGRYAPSV